MYGGVVAEQKYRDRSRPGRREQVRHAHPHKAPSSADGRKDGKKYSFSQKFLEYIKKRLDPTPDEESEESLWPPPGARHRPEPPRLLAAHSRFTAHEIKLIYRGFKQECPSGLVDEESFKNIFCQFFPLGDATPYAQLVFNTIKHKQTGKVNFEEFLDILSRVARGSEQEKLAWVFALYDADGDGRISREELAAVARAVYALLGPSAAPPASSADADQHVDRIFHQMDADADGWVSAGELAGWLRARPALRRSLHTLDTVL